ncbi:MAG: hypothetical protein GMKNLPBB_03204 [Myxococcota bacterium]|nr:hypothetical protein [Myxococcota bacterium]
MSSLSLTHVHIRQESRPAFGPLRSLLISALAAAGMLAGVEFLLLWRDQAESLTNPWDWARIAVHLICAASVVMAPIVALEALAGVALRQLDRQGFGAAWLFGLFRRPKEVQLQAAASGSAMIAAAGGFFVAVFAANRVFITSFKNKDFAAFVLALLVLALVAAAAGLWLPLRRLFAGWLRLLDDWLPRYMSPANLFVWCGYAVCLVALGIGLVVGRYWDEFAIVYEAHQTLLVYAVVFFTSQVVAWALIERMRQHRNWMTHTLGRSLSAAAIVLMFSLHGAATWLDQEGGHAAVRAALLENTAVTSRVLMGLQRAADSDKDGFSGYFAGGDCDDHNSAVYPGAVEVAGNGLDDDCLGGDEEPSVTLEAPEPAVLTAAPASAPATQSAVAVPPRNVVWIIVDTLRADRMSTYGAKRKTSPKLDELAAEGVVFDRAFANAPMTKMSVPSMLSGLWPSEIDLSDAPLWPVVQPANQFISEWLQSAGWRTGLVAAHWYFLPQYGMNQGFDDWDTSVTHPDDKVMLNKVTSPDINKVALRYLDARMQDQKRFFYIVHYFDPHHTFLEHKGVEKFGSGRVDIYDHEILFTDRYWGEIFDKVRGGELAKNTLIVFSADHGEAFGEHGYLWHGNQLYDDQIRVPLVVWGPGVKPGRISGVNVSNLDLVPTILEFLGVPVQEKFRGVSLMPYLSGGEAQPHPPIVAEMLPDAKRSSRKAIIEGDYKLLWSESYNYYNLYNFVSDPVEKKDILAQQKDIADQMKMKLAAMMASRRKTTTPPVARKK